MRRFAMLLSVIVVILAGVVVVEIQSVTLAQEATPAGEVDAMMPEGLSFESLGYGVATTLPSAPADLSLFRLGLESGATFEFDPNDPSVALAYVESGVVTFAVEAPMTVLRTEEETETIAEIAPGVEFTLSAGQSAVFPPNVVGMARNAGNDPVSLLVANIAPLEDMMPESEANQASTPAP